MKNDPLDPWAALLSPMNAERTGRMPVGRLLNGTCRRCIFAQFHGRCHRALAVAVAIALIIPLAQRSLAAWQQFTDQKTVPDPSRPAPAAQPDDQALKEFLDLYSLSPKQNLKRIEPPRPASINAYWKHTYPRSQKDIDKVRAFTFRFSDPDHLRLGWSQYGASAGFRVHDLLRYMNTGLFPAQIEGDAKLLNTPVSGDWVYRERVPLEELIPSLEPILQRAFRLRITLTLRRVERDVVVARGKYRYAPLPGRADNAIEIYGTYLDTQGTGGGGSGDFSEFLRWVGEWIERPVVNEVEAPPKEEIGWHYNAHSPFTEAEKRADHDEASVLKHLQEQTSLSFTLEKKPIRVLFVERPNGKAK